MNVEEKHYKNIFYIIFSFTLFLLLFALFYPRIGLSYHGNYHQTIIYQILNGRVPPEHPCLAGVPINYPWAFHLIMASVQKLSGLNFIKSFQVLNIFTYIGFVYFIYKANKVIFKTNRKRYMSILMSIFGLNILAAIFFLLRMNDVKDLTIIQPDDLLRLTSFIRNSRYAYFFPKFLNVSGYPLGLLLISVYYYKIIQIIYKKRSDFITYFSLTIISILALFLHPYSGLFIFIILFPSFILINVVRKQFNRNHLYLIILHIFAGIVVLPYLASITGSSENITFILRKREFLRLLQSYPIHVFLLSIVAFKLLRKNKLRLLELSMIELFFLIASFLVTIIVTISTFKGDNNYKFVQLLSLTLSPLLVLRLGDIFDKRKFSQFYLIISILVVAKLSLTAYSYFGSNWAKETMTLGGRYKQIEKVTDSNDIFVNQDEDFYDMRGGYVSKRRIYAVHCPSHTEDYLAFGNRIDIMKDLSKDNINYIKNEFPESKIIIINSSEVDGMEQFLLSIGGEPAYIIDQK